MLSASSPPINPSYKLYSFCINKSSDSNSCILFTPVLVARENKEVKLIDPSLFDLFRYCNDSSYVSLHKGTTSVIITYIFFGFLFSGVLFVLTSVCDSLQFLSVVGTF